MSEQICIKYLANTGFLITGAGHNILVDSVFSKRFAPFSAMPKQLLCQILHHSGEFCDVDIMIATHCHPDHCEPHDLLGLKDKRLRLILPADVYSCTGNLGADLAQPTMLLNDSGVAFEDETLRITAISTVHDRNDLVYGCMHFSYLLEFLTPGINLLIMGDAATGPKLLEPWIKDKHINAMTINFVEINQPKGRDFIRELNASLTLLCHLPLPADDEHHIAKLAARSLERRQDELPPCTLCVEPVTDFYISKESSQQQ